MSSNECAALADLHNALDPAGGILPKWTTTIPPGGFINGSCCDWQWAINTQDTVGVWCDSTRNTVTHLRLEGLRDYGYGLQGTIPPDAIKKLTGLRAIELGWNPMTGTIPQELGSLASLTHIGLQWNSISGALPSEVAGLRSLRSLEIDNSRMTGLPKNFGSLSALSSTHCWLVGVQETCRPNPYPSACSRNSYNLPMNTLPPCPPYTATTTVFSIGTETATVSPSESFTTRSMMSSPTSSGTITEETESPSETPATPRQQRYTVFGSLFGTIVALILALSVFRRRIHRRSEQSVDHLKVNQTFEARKNLSG